MSQRKWTFIQIWNKPTLNWSKES